MLLIVATLAAVNACASPSLTNTFLVTRYELHGNLDLDPAATRDLLAGAIGPAVSLGCICRTMASLRKACQQHGYPEAMVALPEQLLTNGVVVVNVFAGSPVSLNKTPAPVPATFAVRQYEVVGNTVLSPHVIASILKTATGPAMTVAGIRQAALSLQNAYWERGYATVAVRVPAQRLTNATVRLLVTEGTLADVQIIGNHHFDNANILRALPSAKTNTLPNSHALQRDLDQANENRDRQIYPSLAPGPEPGTSALILRVKDRFPLHAHADLDNYSTPDTPDLRANVAVQYDNLWQREQQLGLAYSFTPQEMKSMGNTPDYGFNQPLISSYSAFYRIPLPGSDAVSAPENSSRFGYQEATHQFLLPPAQTSAELNIYASASASDTGVQWSPASVVSQSALQTTLSQDSGESVQDNQNVGAQYHFPLMAGPAGSLSGIVGLDYKRSTLAAYNTNNFFIATVTTNLYGANTTYSTNSLAQPVTNAVAVWFPVNVGLDYSEKDTSGDSAVTLEMAGNVAGSDAHFAQQSYSSQARAVYGKLTLAASRDQHLPGNCSVLGRFNGQAASGALINNEQFALGGINSVRGYYEGDTYGDDGWCGSLEFRSPWVEAPVASLHQFVPAWVRGIVFMDGGQCFLLAPDPGAEATRWLWGTGFGLCANVNNHLDARVVIAWPLVGSANTQCGDPRVNFTIGGQF